MAVFLAVLGLNSAMPNPALADQDADFSRYCRENYPGSQYQKNEQSWGIQHVCNQGGTRQGIDFAQACILTTGNPNHRLLGNRVICSGDAQTDQDRVKQVAGPLDIARFCNEKHPGSRHEARPEATGIKHYCRQPGATGGFTLHPIDLADACEAQRQVRGYINAGVQVLCTNANFAGIPRPGEGGSGGGGGGTFPKLKPEEIIKAKKPGRLEGESVKYSNLQNCGNGDPDYMIRLPFSAMKRGLGGQTFDYMGLTMSCPGLENGVVISFDDVCNRFSGAKPPMEVRLLPNGLPICWKEGRKRWPPRDGEAGWGLNGKPLTGVCNEAYFGRPPSAEDLKEEKMTALLKYDAGALTVECFYIPTATLQALLKS
ncbi:MAG: hypothetical protein AAGE61_15040 [Pseudomonadota bacterium]